MFECAACGACFLTAQHTTLSRGRSSARSRISHINSNNDEEVVRFDLTEDYSTETAMIFGELYKRGSEWKFRAIGQGFSGGLRTMANQFGVNV